MKPETEKSIIHCLLLTLAIFIPYHQVAQHRFIEFDDGLYTFLNTYIVNGLNWESVVWAFTNTDAANWHPLTWISHLVDRELFGPHPGGYLLMNVAWHTLAACLCYLAFLKCTQQRFFAFVVALFFAIHPANVENVAWTSERKSLLDAVFWFMGVIAYLQYLEDRRWKFYGILIITHLLGLMAKAMHVTFPCTLVLIHLVHQVSIHGGQSLPWQDYRATVWRSIKLVWPMLALSLYFSLVTASAQTRAMSSLEVHSISGRIVNVIQSYQTYVSMFFHPQEFAPFYPLYFTEKQWDKAIFPVVFLVGITAVLLVLAKKRPIPLLGWFWYLGTMVPVIGLVQVGSQSHADRYLYIPMIGLSFAFPELFAGIRNLAPRVLAVFQSAWIGLAAVALIVATFIQVSYWRNGITLFQHSLQVTGDCLTSVNCLTAALMRNDRVTDAVRFLDAKINVAQNPTNIAKFNHFKANAYLALEENDKALKSVQTALELGLEESGCYWTLANIYHRLGKHQEAKTALEKSRKLQKPKVRMNLMDENMSIGMELLEKDIDQKLSDQNVAGDQRGK